MTSGWTNCCGRRVVGFKKQLQAHVASRRNCKLQNDNRKMQIEQPQSHSNMNLCIRSSGFLSVRETRAEFDDCLPAGWGEGLSRGLLVTPPL